jgi:nonribosomal peptide synthetase protein VioO
LVPHGALAAAVRSLTAVFGVTAQDRVLSFASMNWDTSGEEIYPTLSAGATLVIDRRAVSGSVMGLFTAVEAHSITVLDLPTSFWTEVVDFLDVSGRPFPRSLRLVVIGGEEVRAGAVRSWCEHVPDDVRLLNTYGQTETALVTHAADVGGIRGRFLTDTARVPIGEPLPHVRQVLVSVDAGPGVAELLIGGPSVALGYQNLPAETAERFITLPGAGGERFYRTGDLVEARPDGQLTYIGRADRQLKVRGFRIEPEEVERALLTHPGLRAVAVRAAASPGGGQRLAATVVTVADARVTKSELGEWLKARVPPHMVPTLISFTGALPLLPNGKIDYAMLDNHSDMPSPTDAAASEIASIAGRILNRPLDVKEDFFEGGGDSLLATRLISRIYKAFDVELTFVDVFDARTPQQLAALVVRANGATFNRAGA